MDAFLRDADSYVAHQLGWLGRKAREAIPSLRRALTDPRPQVRYSAAAALAQIDPSALETIPILIEALNHQDDWAEDVDDAPQALATLGPKARAALPKLLELIRKGSPDPGVLQAALEIDVEGKECVPALISALKLEDAEVLGAAARYLGLLGPKAKDAVAALADTANRRFDLLPHLEDDPRVSAIKSLGRIGPAASQRFPP